MEKEKPVIQIDLTVALIGVAVLAFFYFKSMTEQPDHWEVHSEGGDTFLIESRWGQTYKLVNEPITDTPYWQQLFTVRTASTQTNVSYRDFQKWVEKAQKKEDSQ